MEILEWLHLLSANVNLTAQSQSAVNSLFIAYLAVAIFMKKSRYLLAFCFCVIVSGVKGFGFLSEYQIYLTSFVVYSYMALQDTAKKTKIACVIMCVLALVLTLDAFKYGINGIHGPRETGIYKNIEYLSLCANIIIILTLISFRRIYNCICCLLDYAFSLQAGSSYMCIFWYTKHNRHSTSNFK